MARRQKILSWVCVQGTGGFQKLLSASEAVVWCVFNLEWSVSQLFQIFFKCVRALDMGLPSSSGDSQAGLAGHGSRLFQVCFQVYYNGGTQPRECKNHPTKTATMRLPRGSGKGAAQLKYFPHQKVQNPRASRFVTKPEHNQGNCWKIIPGTGNNPEMMGWLATGVVCSPKPQQQS